MAFLSCFGLVSEPYPVLISHNAAFTMLHHPIPSQSMCSFNVVVLPYVFWHFLCFPLQLCIADVSGFFVCLYFSYRPNIQSIIWDHAKAMPVFWSNEISLKFNCFNCSYRHKLLKCFYCVPTIVSFLA